jgi:cell division protein FtsI/penicillin-binding protein 2
MMEPNQNIPAKANRVVNIILLCLLLILIRVWYLGVVQHEKQLEQAHRPQRRVVIEPIERATVRDRFDIPLAVNKMQYNAAVCYAHIREIPSISWVKDEKGKTVRVQPRMEHITHLAQLLGAELDMDPVVIEDTIHGKASLFPHTPFVIKEDISEEQYFRLRMLEKEWLGLQMQRAAKRWYPQGKVACDVLGYLGAISHKKYLGIAEEIHELEEYLAARERNETPFLPKGFDTPLQVRERLYELQEQAYTINDLVGQAGVEAFYENELRGLQGKKVYEVDVKGNYIRKLPISRKAVSGRRINLTISAELQDFAEKLLAANEKRKTEEAVIDENWMRGGAIVAMIPQTGEIVAFASYPKFDPNDFIPTRDPNIKQEKEAAVQKWLESLNYIGEIWDGKRPLEREYFSFTKGSYIKEHLMLTWPIFLETILPEGALQHVMRKITDLQSACRVQEAGIDHPFLREIASEADRFLVVDLARLVVRDASPQLLAAVGNQSISDYFILRQAAVQVQTVIKREVQELFHDLDFTSWRKQNFKEYLKRKRKEEKEEKKFTRPYTEYLDAVEKKLFQAFWDAYGSVFTYTAIAGIPPIAYDLYPHLQPYFAHLKTKEEPSLKHLRTLLKSMDPHIGMEYLQTFRSFDKLDRPLLGKYRRIRKSHGVSLEKHLAAAFYPPAGYSYGRSYAYRQTTAQGSVFKLITTYAALMERVQSNERNVMPPLTLIDDLKGDKRSKSPTQVLGMTLDGQPILRMHKGGQLPRSSHSGIGKIDLLGALEQSSNIYFSILAREHLTNPNQLTEAARLFGYGAKTGIDLPGEVPGTIPDDLTGDISGIYSYAIGQHTQSVTPLQTAVMIATIANQGKVVKPKILQKLSGKEIIREEEVLFSMPDQPFQNSLSLVGIHFPLFTGAESQLEKGFVYAPPTEIVRSFIFPKEVYRLITEGMRRSVMGPRGSSRPSIMYPTYDSPTAFKDYYEIHRDLLAKTGTAQFLYKQTLDAATEAEIRRNIWFAVIANKNAQPELVVVVFLRFSQAGREGGPMAGQVIKKWHEIKSKY